MTELPYFRGAVIGMVGRDHVLFHNHQDDGFRYSYPLIQYKRIGGRAAVVCIGDGALEIGQLLANMSGGITLGNRSASLGVDDIRGSRLDIQLRQSPLTYTIHKYLPFNQTNYRVYREMTGIVEKTSLLERCLTGNILSMGKGLGIRFEDTVIVKVLDIDRSQPCTYKGVQMEAFDLTFACNVSLPDFIGLGKGVSTGYGMIHRNQ